MRDFGFPQLGPMYLYEDSRAVIAMAENPSNRKGARHIDTREHFVDQLVKDRIVKLVQCRTHKMVADADYVRRGRGAVFSDDVSHVGA
jgi:hypothetical protein